MQHPFGPLWRLSLSPAVVHRMAFRGHDRNRSAEAQALDPIRDAPHVRQSSERRKRRFNTSKTAMEGGDRRRSTAHAVRRAAPARGFATADVRRYALIATEPSARKGCRVSQLANASSAPRPATISAKTADRMTSTLAPERGWTRGSASIRSVRTNRTAATTSSATPTTMRARPS